jgi:NAD(P)H-quinone oxidoreductase subunit 4L
MADEIQNSNRKSAGSAPTTIAFSVVVLALLGALLSGRLVLWLQNFGLNNVANFSDIAVFLVIVILATLAAAMPGAHRISIISIAGFAGFLALTYNQEMLIKYLSLAALLFSIGMYGMVASRNAVRVLMSIELMLNAVNLNLVAFARYVDPVHIRGQVFAIFILTVAAAEAAVGLAIVLAVYRNTATVDMEKFNLLKW